MKRNSKSLKQALDCIGMVQTTLLSLDELGRKMPPQMSGFLLRYSVEGMTSLIRDQFAEAQKRIPASQALGAGTLLNKSLKALDALDMAVALVNQSEHGDAETLPKSVRDVTGRIIVALTSEAGRWSEQAWESLGGSPAFGWLEGQSIEGLAGVMRVDEQQRKVAREFGRLNPEHRENVSGVISRLVQTQD